ncbi:hypothetical protein NOF04DRAFT_9770 [Fusarium oxysporum II5]|uniref:Uncharacterized protein n=2 Tax=Fusarium oxysporum species complex TaxID=171631 RepID=X0IM27_FUSO5|nr:uncharacterized protein FOIG_16826 [Fusarium odoratissimum NRRL 54006]EXL89892.1 hypothetical protein FOIG_16826 [Fusarium odoratissimum NRRL 54006]KAK2122001.1 hypothetical protein NOF04DRAFT_1403302 [Fusarium oxysporum II5]KAK2122014.1 hypothetical protein NOF04DRAFT_9770 [Fusarium oxysporum II5]TVY74436.1 hypothetical protein Focb16_v005703 [Fusarium oxysporum f. sp. cubense]
MSCHGAGCTSFTNQCVAIIQGLSSPIPGLVDKSGFPISAPGAGTWGVNYTTCEKYCGFSKISVASTFNFATFAAAMTSYFLPWLALTAQLPFENAGPSETFVGLCLAIGSPALITYSLALTLFNRSWAVDTVRRILNRSRRYNREAAAEIRLIEDRLKSFLCLAVEGQQVPLRATVAHHWLSSLIVSPVNQAWWTALRDHITNSRRRPSLSFHVQVGLAGCVWLFTIISGVQVALGAINTAIHLATSTLWVWLIPVTWGWIWAGTQYHKGSVTISKALQAATAYHALPASEDFAESPTQDGVQIGIWVDVESGLTLEPRQAEAQQVTMGPVGHQPSRLPETLMMNVRGDERQEGPVYNYARVFTWSAFTRRIIDAFDTTLTRLGNGVRCDMLDLQRTQQQAQQGPPIGGSILVGTASQTSTYCGLPVSYPDIPPTNQPTPVRAYINFSEMGVDVYKRILEALIVALFTQWGTTGAAIIMAYYTPMIGFGCRSGSYLLYGILSTVVLFILILSMALSHQAMRMYQAEHIRPPTTNFSKRWTVTWTHWLFCFGSNITRLAGKFLAVANSIVLVQIAVLEFVGLFDNCWCKSCHLQFGDNGYAVLFRSNEDYQKIAEGSWIGGLSMATIVTSILCLIFFFSTRKG